MEPEKQRIAIAEACGWTFRKPTLLDRIATLWSIREITISPEGREHSGWYPNYPGDLNAMHEAEKVLCNQFTTLEESYWRNLSHVKPHPIYATAAQRAEAFLKTLNLWETKQ